MSVKKLGNNNTWMESWHSHHVFLYLLTHQMDKNTNTIHTSELGRVLLHSNNKKTLSTDLRVLTVTDS